VSEAAPSAETPAATQLQPEDEGRAAFYGLIARLFYAPPDEQLLAQLLHARAFEDGGGERGALGEALAVAWRELVDACGKAFPVVLENEHTELFVGTGKSEVTVYLSHYVLRHANDNPLVGLRAQLAQWGIARHERVGEPEDHIAGICEAMRFAIAVQHRSLDEQKAFFDAFVYRGAAAFCDAVNASAKASFYRLVANFARAFFELEREAFEIM
jgi:TorA maturation chaperone TorD